MGCHVAVVYPETARPGIAWAGVVRWEPTEVLRGSESAVEQPNAPPNRGSRPDDTGEDTTAEDALFRDSRAVAVRRLRSLLSKPRRENGGIYPRVVTEHREVRHALSSSGP